MGKFKLNSQPTVAPSESMKPSELEELAEKRGIDIPPNPRFYDPETAKIYGSNEDINTSGGTDVGVVPNWEKGR